MKLILTTAFALLFVVAPAFALNHSGWNQYGWTISSSAADPFVNTGGVAPGGLAHLYLWYSCAYTDGMSAADFALSGVGSVIVAGFSPMNGFLNAGSGLNLLLAVGGCPWPPVVAGEITIIWLGSAADVCIVPSNTGLLVTVDCASPTPNAWPIETIGWGALGVPACFHLYFCSPTAMEPRGWGSVKSLYR